MINLLAFSQSFFFGMLQDKKFLWRNQRFAAGAYNVLGLFLLAASCQYQYLFQSPKSFLTCMCTLPKPVNSCIMHDTDLMKQEQFLMPDSQIWTNAS